MGSSFAERGQMLGVHIVSQLSEGGSTAGFATRVPERDSGMAGRAALQVADRWLFVFMGALFVATALIGFVPSSLEKTAAVSAGDRPPFPLALHAHAMAMGMWLLLLLVQASLIATTQKALHRKLGISSLILVPTIIAAGIGVVRASWDLPPIDPDPAALAEAKAFGSNLLVMQIRVAIMFPTLVGLALWVRRSDPGSHKRLMFLATAWLLQAAINRTGLFPTTSPDLSMLLWLMPMFGYDLVRYRRVLRAYVIWAVVSLPPTIAAHALWGSSWWLATAPKIMGVEPW
jgi:hypothetical protein